MIRMFGGRLSLHRGASFSFHGPAERLERRDWQKGPLHKKYIVGAHRAPLQLRTPSCRGGL